MRPATATAVLGASMLLVAALFDAEPLYVPGVAFIFVSVLAAAWVTAAARGITVAREIGVRTVVEEQTVRIELVIGTGRLPLPSGEVVDELLAAPAPLAVGTRRTVVRIDARFARRGRKRLTPPSVIVRDPLSLATRVVGDDEPAELLVLPRLEPVRAAPGSGDGTGLSIRRGRPTVAAEVDLDGLRPYRDGAPASRIFWPALARRGELMERRLRAEGDTRPLVVLDPRAPASDDALDAAVRAAASLCVHLARGGGCALLLPGDRRPTALEASLSTWAHLHVRLALVEAGHGAPNIAGLAGRRGPVLYVVARASGRPPQAVLHAPGAQRLLIVPGELAGRRAQFTVAGCNGYELGVRHARSARARAGAGTPPKQAA